MAEVAAGLGEADLPAPRMLAGLSWRSASDACLAAELVIINGEGALHHGRPAVAEVIELAKQRGGKATVLLNTSWFDNPAELTRDLASFAIVSARESASAANIGAHGPQPRVVPDLAIRHALRSGIRWQGGGPAMAGDSTKPDVTRRLRSLAARRNWDYLPALAFPETVRPGKKSRKIHQRARWARALGPFARFLVSPRYHAHAVGVASTRDYLSRLAASGGVITGRFHTVCFALALRVPFLAVGSNTPKIEAILSDAGLDPARRVIAPSKLDSLSQVPPFDADELATLDAFADRAEAEASRLFADIAALRQPRS